MKRSLQRALVRTCWWLFPPLGTTVNEYFGGGKTTGLWGGYERREPLDSDPER